MSGLSAEKLLQTSNPPPYRFQPHIMQIFTLRPTTMKVKECAQARKILEAELSSTQTSEPNCSTFHEHVRWSASETPQNHRTTDTKALGDSSSPLLGDRAGSFSCAFAVPSPAPGGTLGGGASGRGTVTRGFRGRLRLVIHGGGRG